MAATYADRQYLDRGGVAVNGLQEGQDDLKEAPSLNSPAVPIDLPFSDLQRPSWAKTASCILLTVAADCASAEGNFGWSSFILMRCSV
ncbi:MAG: hypothetical protein ACI8TF_000291 [Paracoccaceae bacterium]|jgi:hypothetical protein